MPYSAKILKGLDELDPKVKVVILDLLEEIEKNIRETVKRNDFDELKAALTELTKSVHELTEAQKKSEERINKIEIAISELTEAQKRTEQRVNELAEAQKKTEEKIKELAEAQRRTEDRLNELAKIQQTTIDRLEGISNSVGYSLENNAYKSLPVLLKKEGIDVDGKIIRRYYEENQINIWGYGRKNDETILILGEVKVRPSKKEINKFIRIVDKITKKEKRRAFTVFIAHDYHPDIEKYLNEKGIKYYWSYELE